MEIVITRESAPYLTAASVPSRNRNGDFSYNERQSMKRQGK
jgi:hypothetical protein